MLLLALDFEGAKNAQGLSYGQLRETRGQSYTSCSSLSRGFGKFRFGKEAGAITSPVRNISRGATERLCVRREASCLIYNT